MTAPISFRGFSCRVQISAYPNGRPAIVLVDDHDGEPVAAASVNLPDEQLAEGEVVIKDYSENAGMLAALTSAGVVEDTGRRAWAGRVQVPVCRVVGR